MSLVTKLQNNPIALIGSIWVLSDLGYYFLLPLWELPQAIMKTARQLHFTISIGLGGFVRRNLLEPGRAVA